MENMKGCVTFDSEITTESVKELIKDIENALLTFDEIILYFSCPGGEASATEVLLDYLNRYADVIEIVGFWSLSSAGFDIIYFFNGKVKILDSGHSALHLGTNVFDTRSALDKESFTNFHKKLLTQENNKYLKKLKPILTVDEYKKMKDGKDIFFDCHRLRKILKGGVSKKKSNKRKKV